MSKAKELTHKILSAVNEEENPVAIIAEAVIEKEFSEIVMIMQDAIYQLETKHYTDSERQRVANKLKEKIIEIKDPTKIR